MAIKGVSITLDKVRMLRLNMNACVKLADLYDINMMYLDVDVIKGLDGSKIAKILWAGLVHEDKDLTLEGLIHILDENCDSLQVLTDMATKAIMVAFGIKDAVEGKESDQKN